jgi:hypothetical protein
MRIYWLKRKRKERKKERKKEWKRIEEREREREREKERKSEKELKRERDFGREVNKKKSQYMIVWEKNSVPRDEEEEKGLVVFTWAVDGGFQRTIGT